MIKWSILFSIFLLAIAGCSGVATVITPTPTPAGALPGKEKPAWQVDWDKTVAAARQEGEVVLVTTASASTRQELAGPLKSKYGIDLQFVVGSGPDLSEKVAAQRRAGLFLFDFYLGGATTATTTMKPAGYLDP